MIFTNDALINALSWTLIHSLWQGILTAAAGALLLALAGKAQAKLRYAILCSFLCVFVLATAATFWWEIQIQLDDKIATYTLGQIQNENVYSRDGYNITAADAVISFIDRNALWITAAWFVLLCLKSFGFFRQLRKLNKMRHFSTSPVPEEWVIRFAALKAKLGIIQRVALLESGLATVPCAIGFLKPAILIPVGLLASLPCEQVEAILLHELAHIRRRDFVMNLLQTLVEALFFFNPAITWLNTLIREERENCCDDIALSISQDRPSLVRALLSISEGVPVNALAVAFPGRKNFVLTRTQRILGVKSRMISQFEKGILAILILCFVIAIMTYPSEKEQMAAIHTTLLEELPKDFDAFDDELQKDMISKGIISDTVGMSYKLSKEDFIVNGKLQPEDIHRQFKTKYMRYKNMTATYYNWQFKE